MKSDSKDVSVFSWLDLLKAFYFLLDKNRKRYFLYTTALIIILFYDLVPTLVIGKVVDFFTHYNQGDSLNVFYFYVILLTITMGVVAIIRLTIKKKLSDIRSHVSYFTKVKGFERLLDFSIGWHDKENTGNKVQRINSGVDALKQMQGTISNDLFMQVTSIVGVLISFIFLQPLFFVFSLIYIAIFLSIQISFYRRMVTMTNENNIILEKAGGTYYEGLSNILTIKTLGVKGDFKKNVVSREALARDYAIKKVTMINDKWKYFQVVNAVSIGGILLLSGKNFVAGAISLGSIFIIYNFFQKLRSAIQDSTDTIEKLIEIKVSISRMMPIFWEDSLAGTGHLDFPKDWNNIMIKNASFHYPHKPEQTTDAGIKNITFIVDKYQKIGVVGKSGSGKSTFAKILLGLYKFNEGTFNMGDVKFSDIKHDEITKEIALVLQESEMFNLSLRENITLMREFNPELFERSVTISQLKDLIDKLPNGIETIIGEKGYRLSGGERQRIGIARAIYKDPQIIVLDEATSSLDSKTESLIQNAFEENLKKKTVISIAHRVSTLKNVDKIVVFDDEKIVEEGTFQGLSHNTNSKFFEIYKQQNENQSQGLKDII